MFFKKIWGDSCPPMLEPPLVCTWCCMQLLKPPSSCRQLYISCRYSLALVFILYCSCVRVNEPATLLLLAPISGVQVQLQSRDHAW